MNTSPKKSHGATLLVLSIIGIVILLCVILMRDNLNRLTSDTLNSSPNFPAQTLGDSTPTFVDPPPSIDNPAKLSSAIGDGPAASSDEASENDDRYFTSLGPPPADAIVVSGSRSTAFGVVDLERLLAFQLGPDSPDARASVLRNIRRIVAIRAAAHGFAFVLDSSAKSSSGTPFILATNGVPDITDEVLQELSQ